MEVKVRTPSRVRVQVSPAAPVNAVMRRVMVSNANVEDLLNVIENVDGLYDGFTLVYDINTNSWRTAPVSATLNDGVDMDGGTY